MTLRRTFAWLMERRYSRRCVTLPLTIGLGLLAVVLTPVTLVIAALFDRGRPWQRVRLVALITGALVIEIGGIVAAFIIWVVTGFGLFQRRAWTLEIYRWLLGRYTATLFTLIRTVLGARVEWRTESLPSGPVIMLARHTSFFDALVPGTVLASQNALLPHHVVTSGLRYLPCIDLVGHRYPNRFIRRTPGEGSAELVEITKLGQHLNATSAAVIFPEGTFRSDDRFDRAVLRLRRNTPALAERAATLTHVLPPRSNGSHALLAGAPAASVVICTNTGLEPFGTLAEIKANLRADRPIIVETWNVERADIPEDADSFNEWLFDEFVRIDQWVEAETS